MDTNNPPNQPVTTEEARRYQREKVGFRLNSMALNLIFLSIMALAGGGVWLDQVVEPFSAGNRWLHALEFVLLFGLASYVLNVPLSFLSGYLHEHKYKLSNQTLGAWAWRELKELSLVLILNSLLLLGLYALLHYLPNYWWLAAAGAMLAVSVVFAQLFPVLLVPMFYKLEPVAGDDLLQRFRKLAEGTGISIESVQKLGLSRDTKKANAYLAGLGRTKQVALGDTLLDEFSPEEVGAVFAHELGHSVHNHLIKGIIGSAVMTTAGLFFCDLVIRHQIANAGHPALGAVSTLPLVLFVLTAFNTIMQPLHMAVARHFERQSDWFSLEKTRDPIAFKAAFARLAALNKSDLNPPRWTVILFYSHPPISERIAMADTWVSRQSADGPKAVS